MPPWERERLPLLFSGDDLVWVPGLGIDARFQASPGSQGLVPEWLVFEGAQKKYLYKR